MRGAPWLATASVLAVVLDFGQLSAASDLSITATALPDPVVAGTLLTYQLSVTNAGPDAATSTVVELELATGLYLSRGGTLIFADGFESGNLAAWTLVVAGPSGCSQSGTVIRCALGTLADGATAPLTLGVAVPTTAQGTLQATASVSSAVADPDPFDNSVTLSTPVVRHADLALAVIAAPDPVSPGGLLTTTWTVTNLGPSAATGAHFDDPLPPELSLISALSTQGSCSGTRLVHCELGSLASGAQATVTVKTQVAANASGAITDSASTEALESDLDLANNIATAVTTVAGSRFRLPLPEKER